MELDVPSAVKNKEDERPSIQTQHLAELVCPVCYEYMQPPIMMCESGHSICALCHELMSDCPLCQGKLTFRRSSALEALTAVIMFPCKHCNKRFRLEELEEHNCFEKVEGPDHSPIATCIIGQVYGDCVWSGPSMDMSIHCSKQHPQHFWTAYENSATWKYSDFANIGVQNVFVVDLSTAFFVIVQKYNSQLRNLSWNLSCECINNERFDYEIQVLSDGECVLMQRTHIENAFNIMTFFPSNNEIVIHLDKVTKFLTQENTINYKIIIRKRNDNLESNVPNIINGNSVEIKQAEESSDKRNCVTKTWNSIVIFYNSVKKCLHLT